MKKKRRFGRRVFCVLIVLFMGVIWQSDLLSQEPAEVRSLRKQEILQTDDNYREYYFGLLTEDEKKIYREMLSGIQERQDEFYLTSSNEQLISKVYHALLKDHPELFWVHNREEVYTTAYKGIFTWIYVYRSGNSGNYGIHGTCAGRSERADYTGYVCL